VKSIRYLFALAAACLPFAPAVGVSGASAAETTPTTRFRELLVAGQWTEALKLAKPAARWPDRANGSEGLIKTDTPILLDWDLCVFPGSTNAAAAPRPHISRYPWLEFAPASNGLTATLYLRVSSYPKTAWRLRFQQVDRAGAFVVVHQKQERLIENSGTIERIPLIENLEAAFHLGAGNKGALFQVSIETVWTEQGNPVRWYEPIPLELCLPTAEQSHVFRAESLKLEQTNNAVLATVQAEIISRPKTAWRLTLDLSDKEGKRVGHGERVVENGGYVISRPSYSSEPIQFAVPGDVQARGAAQCWTLRIAPEGEGPREP
jgi:hypothetical protein